MSGQFERSAVDDVFRRLMSSANRSVAMEIGKHILRGALEFWERSCHVRLEQGALKEIRDSSEFSDLHSALTYKRLGSVKNGELLTARKLSYEASRQRSLRPGTRKQGRSWLERVNVARVAAENLLLLRNVDDHRYESIDDPGKVAAVAGTLLMLLEHAGDLKPEIREASERLKDEARKALEFCAEQLDDDDEPSETEIGLPGAAEASLGLDHLARVETKIDALSSEVTALASRSEPDGRRGDENGALDVAGPEGSGANAAVAAADSARVEEILKGLKSLDARLTSVAEGQAAMDARLGKGAAFGDLADRSDGRTGDTFRPGADVAAIETLLQQTVAELKRMSTRGLAEGDLRYLQSLVKKDIGLRTELGDLGEVHKAVTEVKGSVDLLQGSLVGEDALEQAAARGVARALAEEPGRRLNAEAISSAAARGAGSVVEELARELERSLGAGQAERIEPAVTGLLEGLRGNRDAIEELASQVRAFRDETWPRPASVAKPATVSGEPEEPPIDWHPPSEPADLLTPQQAENRLVALRNAIKEELRIEWYDCILQRKFIGQMIREKIRTRDEWVGAQGAIGSWFADPRNRDKGDEVDGQWRRYGERISEIMDRIMDDEVRSEARVAGRGGFPDLS